MTYANVPSRIREISGHLKTQEMRDEAVRMELRSLGCLPDHFKTEEICNEAVRREPYTLRYVPDQYKTQEMCDEVMRVRPAAFFLIPDRFKTQEMCNKAVEEGLDWLVVLEEMLCHGLIIIIIIIIILLNGGIKVRPRSCEDEKERERKKIFLTIWYAEIKNVLMKEDVEIWSKKGYD